MTTDYQPKHMKVYDDDWDHCCFGGCRPMDEHGCCANMGWHKNSCPLNPWRIADDAFHDIYVRDFGRKHLASEQSVPQSVPASRCPRCGNFVGLYGNGRCKPDLCLEETKQ